MARWRYWRWLLKPLSFGVFLLPAQAERSNTHALLNIMAFKLFILFSP
ncbi:Hypothetical protein ABZS17I87_00454 [Kosakonia cowanii]